MKTIKKMLLVTVLVMATLMCFVLFASAEEETGQCGENVYWHYDTETKVLTLSGTGPMYDYEMYYELTYWGDEFRSDSPFAFKTISEIIIEEGITTVGKDAFCNAYGRSSIKKISLPDGLITIKERAFLSCNSITEITIPDSVTTIEAEAFAGWTSLESVTLPVSLVNLGNDAFFSTKFIYVDEGNPIYSSDDNGVLFSSDKTKLILYPVAKTETSYTIPDTVTTIGKTAFYTSKLTSIVIPDSVTVIENDAFNDCMKLSEVFLPAGLTYIGARAFSFCYELRSMHIPEKVEFIGSGAFRSCSGLSGITVDEENAHYMTDDKGVLYNKDKTEVVFFCKNCAETEYVIPDGVESIADYAFASPKYLERLIIPVSVTNIGKGALSSSKYCIYYKGSRADLSKISLGEGNAILTDEQYSEYLFCDYNPVKLGRTEKITATNTDTSHTFLNWEKVPDAYGYRLYLKTEDGWKFVVDTRNNYYKVQGLDPNTIYTMAVRAGQKVDGKTVLADSYTTIEVKTNMAAPENIEAKVGIDKVTLSWEPSAGATGYRVYRKEVIPGDYFWGGDEIKWTVVCSSTTKTSCSVKIINYYDEVYAIRPYAKNGNEVIWAGYDTIKVHIKPKPTTGLQYAQNSSAIKLTWEKSDCASGYRIYYRTTGNWKIAVSTTTAITYTFKNLKPGSKYEFAVRPYRLVEGGHFWGEYSTVKTATEPAKVTAKVSSPSKGKITVTWNAVNGADGYELYYKTGNGEYRYYETYGSVKNLTFSNLKSGTKYTFAVRAGIKTQHRNIYGDYQPAVVTVK